LHDTLQPKTVYLDKMPPTVVVDSQKKQHLLNRQVANSILQNLVPTTAWLWMSSLAQ
jgi:hypothetical protein